MLISCKSILNSSTAHIEARVQLISHTSLASLKEISGLR